MYICQYSIYLKLGYISKYWNFPIFQYLEEREKLHWNICAFINWVSMKSYVTVYCELTTVIYMQYSAPYTVLCTQIYLASYLKFLPYIAKKQSIVYRAKKFLKLIFNLFSINNKNSFLCIFNFFLFQNTSKEVKWSR